MEQQNIHPGPIDPSILILQDRHRCNSIWNNEEFDAVLKCSRYDGVTYTKEARDPRVVGYLRVAGFYGVAHLGHITLDHGLITALVERWRPEVHAFHLPFGEVGITLQDVEVLFGLRVDGRVVSGRTDRQKEEWFNRCVKLLGFRPGPNDVTPSMINALALQGGPELQANSPDEAVQQSTRSLIMQLLGGLLFPDTTRKHVRLYFLDLLEDLQEAGQYSWGSAVLAFLYRSMCRAADFQYSSLGGCLVLLQIWAWERLPMVSPTAFIPIQNLGDKPYGARWSCRHRWPTVSKHVIRAYRDQLDCCQERDFLWTPYPLAELPYYCQAGQAIWTSCVPLIMYYVVEHHLPERFCRQFGCVQNVPSNVEYNQDLHNVDGRTSKKIDWCACHREYIALWDNRAALATQMDPRQPNDAGQTSEYRDWYFRISRRLIGNPAHHPAEGYIQSAAIIQSNVELLRRVAVIAHEAIQNGDDSPILPRINDMVRSHLHKHGYEYVLELPLEVYPSGADPLVVQVRRPDKRRERVHLRGGPPRGGWGMRKRREQERAQLRNGTMASEDSSNDQQNLGGEGGMHAEENEQEHLLEQRPMQNVMLLPPSKFSGISRQGRCKKSGV